MATADHLRDALIAAGAKGYGWRSAATWTRKRAGWALALNGAAMEQGISQEQIRELASWAVAAPAFKIDGEEWTWLRVLDVADPGAKLAGKLAAIRNSRERAEKRAAPRLSVVDPGGSQRPLYYDGEERISYETWRERGGRFEDERRAPRRRGEASARSDPYERSGDPFADPKPRNELRGDSASPIPDDGRLF